MCDVVRIPPGDYWVGDDSIPFAGPRHQRCLDRAFWIDALPVTWSHFEVFVTGGGFSDDSLWITSSSGSDRTSSVDQRYAALIEQSHGSCLADFAPTLSLLRAPITGLTWFEAQAVAAFYGARLPYELEWEIANGGNWSSPKDVATGRQASEAQRGTVSFTRFVDRLQEWTLDRFTRTYFRSDYNRRGVRWTTNQDGGVVVRGSTPDDLYHHISFRRMELPQEGHGRRGFRRVWEMEPKEDDVVPRWRN